MMLQTVPNRCDLEFSILIRYHVCLLKAEVNRTSSTSSVSVRAHPGRPAQEITGGVKPDVKDVRGWG